MTQEGVAPPCADCGGAPIAGYLNRTALCADCVRTRCESLDQEIARQQRERSEKALMDVPAWALADREWGPVCWLLTAPALVLERALLFVDFEERDIDWPGMLRASCNWSSSGALLARVAFNVWNGGAPDLLDASDARGAGTVSALLNVLDEANLERLLEAMAMARGRRVVVLRAPDETGRIATREDQA
jgi:hypothetical protein